MGGRGDWYLRRRTPSNGLGPQPDRCRSHRVANGKSTGANSAKISSLRRQARSGGLL